MIAGAIAAMLVVGLMGLVAWFWAIEPDDVTQIAPPPDIAARVGQTVRLEARYRGDAPRHPGAPLPGKTAHKVVLGDRSRLVVHTDQLLDCPGVLVLTGTVIRVDTFARPGLEVAQGQRAVVHQLDVSQAECRRAE